MMNLSNWPGKKIRSLKPWAEEKEKILALVEQLAEYKASVCLFIHNFTVSFDNNQAERNLRMI